MTTNSKCGHSLHGKLSEPSAWTSAPPVVVPEKFLAYFCSIQIMSIAQKTKCFTVFHRLFAAFWGKKFSCFSGWRSRAELGPALPAGRVLVWGWLRHRSYPNVLAPALPLPKCAHMVIAMGQAASVLCHSSRENPAALQEQSFFHP